MRSAAPDEDRQAIAALVARQFASLNWQIDEPADWAAFGADFHDAALLYASARPARPQTPAAFLARMRELSQTSLRSFEERLLGLDIRVFGNVAVAIAAARRSRTRPRPGAPSR